MAFIVKRDAPSLGIPVASTDTIIMAGSGPAYTTYFGPGDADGNYTKTSETSYNLDGVRSMIYFDGSWWGYWDNGDNSHFWVRAPLSSPLYIPTNWGNGITITAA
jgi:hypothetical protein